VTGTNKQRCRPALCSAIPLSSYRQHLSYDVCLEVRGDYQNCSVLLYCVLKLCTVTSTLRWAVLTVLWIGFCHFTVRRFICIYLCVFLCVFCFTPYVLYYFDQGGVNLMGLKPNLWTYLPSVLWHCWFGHLTRKTRTRYTVTYNVFGGTLNLAQSQSLFCYHVYCVTDARLNTKRTGSTKMRAVHSQRPVPSRNWLLPLRIFVYVSILCPTLERRNRTPQ